MLTSFSSFYIYIYTRGLTVLIYNFYGILTFSANKILKVLKKTHIVLYTSLYII